nr:ribonuclease H-like domain-containing protein [Tanacetum cinerariifolium]
RSQDREKKESYKQGPKEEEPSPKALMAIDGIEWDWSYMANEEENHALIADDENNIDDKGYWDSGCSRHMTGNISYLSEYEPYDRGYVSFGHGGGKIIGKGIIKTGKLKFENVYFVKELKFKLNDDTNVLLKTPRQHNMYYNDLNNIVPHKNLTCLVAKASVDEKMNEFCTKKSIRREFSNARTPQQNRVAKRRNITLIEAARTMLADAKLLVTFWAEAVNTACYVQNRVLVNKSQNKTSYELFNSRIPAIGFLRPFGCHVMILNTLYHLGKFDAKGDECYFVGYSLSSKAFRENLLLTFQVQKMVASQAVKKDVSSLRYIALPNWFHEAHMETSNDTIRNSDAQVASQKEQDCNVDVPESSGISNPTATSKVSSADQVEHVVSLTVESEILTVSSPVPTVCLDISLEISSGSRLILKGVFS